MKECKTISINDLFPDDININKGTSEGKVILSRSIERFGLGRSIVIDKNNNVISGNKTLQAAVNAGISKVVVVDSDGSNLVAVKRTDVKIDTKKGREFALADNMANQVNFDIDYDSVKKLMDRAEELHPEIWDIRIPNTELKGYNSDEIKDIQTPTNFIKIGGKKIVIDDDELEALSKSVELYKKTNPSCALFFTKVLDDYEQLNKDSKN